MPIISVLKRARVPCFYLMGNDDNVALGYEDEQIKSLHGKRFSCGSYHLVGYQYTAPAFVGRLFVKSKEEMDQDLRSLEPRPKEPAVLVTHAPAYGTLDRSWNGEHVGSRALAALLDRTPVLAHIHGHIHGHFGRDGNRFNVAAAGQRVAVIIDVPLLEHEVIRAC